MRWQWHIVLFKRKWRQTDSCWILVELTWESLMVTKTQIQRYRQRYRHRDTDRHRHRQRRALWTEIHPAGASSCVNCAGSGSNTSWDTIMWEVRHAWCSLVMSQFIQKLLQHVFLFFFLLLVLLLPGIIHAAQCKAAIYLFCATCQLLWKTAGPCLRTQTTKITQKSGTICNVLSLQSLSSRPHTDPTSETLCLGLQPD